MINFFYDLNPFIQTLIATLFTFSMTISGAGLVLLVKNVNKNIMDTLLGIAAGIMLSSAIFSLLIPALDQSNWKLVSSSILIGSLLLILGDKYSDKLSIKNNNTFIMLVSIILHNIPEGMVIGVAFGSVYYGIDGITVSSAISLALGIGIQNFPEGAAVSIPLRRLGYSAKKSFIVGILSGLVEPIAAIIGLVLVIKIKILLPYLLAFASGAMLYVVIKELIPESMTNKNKNLISYFVLIGFIVMMILELNT